MKTIKLLLLLFIGMQIKAQCVQVIAAGNGFSHYIKTDGTLWAFGTNSDGRLGDGTTINRNTPVNIANNSIWATVSGGNFHAAGIKADGTLWAWGNSFGGYTPTQVGTATNWQSVSAGAFHILALKTDGTLWSFGQNNKGQLGTGSIVNNYTPTQVGTDTNWQSISAGGYHSAAIKTDGTLWAWGDNTSGQLGDGGTTNYRTTPYQVGIQTNWLSISCGGGSACIFAMKTDHTIWGWGSNAFGGLGDGTTTNKKIPQQIGTLSDWQSVQTGYYHTMAIKNDGTLWACGYNYAGQLGDGTLINKTTLIQVGTGSNWLDVYCGGNHTIARKTNGDLLTWGKNNNGQLGDGTFDDKNTPAAIGVCTDLGIGDLSAATVTIYPNPVIDVIYLHHPDNAEVTEISLLDLSGKTIFVAPKNDANINVGQLSSGIYFVKCKINGADYVQKFIKK